jgi:organic hydroperoxide reductase OsmC/OhrA
MNKQHRYNLSIEWQGNTGTGTSGYSAYSRDHIISSENKLLVSCSSDPAFRGNKAKYNPEELLVASIASCHMLWYLHLCADAGVIVVDYKDSAIGIMQETDNGSGFFKEITLYPEVIVKDASMIEKANSLHAKANEYCFIANSVKFPVHHKPVCSAEKDLQRQTKQIG